MIRTDAEEAKLERLRRGWDEYCKMRRRDWCYLHDQPDEFSTHEGYRMCRVCLEHWATIHEYMRPTLGARILKWLRRKS